MLIQYGFMQLGHTVKTQPTGDLTMIHLAWRRTLLSLICSLFFAFAFAFAFTFSSNAETQQQPNPTLNLPDILKPQIDNPTPSQPPALIHSQFVRTGPTIQLAILLDSSNSMDGLIQQAKEQIWNIINQLAAANKDNNEITLQVALYEYGKSSLAKEQGYLQLLSPLSNDLDFLSEQLMNLRTDGGDEYAGKVILQSIQQLNWSTHKDDLKLILIAGNESFEQGDISSEFALNKAQQANIIVNTMFCGDYQQGANLGWQQAAQRANGKYLNIDMNQDIVHIDTPFDQQIAGYGQQLNDTYMGYGNKGVQAKTRQMVQDSNALSSSIAVMAERSVAKASKQYKTQDWDIISLYATDQKKAIQQAKQDNEQFNELDDKQIKEKLEQLSLKRAELEKKINQLQQQRSSYILEQKQQTDTDFGSVLLKNIRQQAIDRGYQFN